MKIAHFFDIDVLINIDSNVWVISKTKPFEPIIRISQSEFNLINKGIYRKYDCQLEIDGKKYWLPENLLNQIKIKCNRYKHDITDLAFSMQEFTNKEIIDKLDYEILTHNFQHLKNKTDDIYILCSRKSKKSYETVINKLEDKLLELGLKVENYYYLSETFYNRENDDISHKKVKLLLQHLMGLKTKVDRFTDEEISKYDKVYFYDDEPGALSLAINSNNLFSSLLKNTEDNIKSTIKNIIKQNDNIIVVRQTTHNKFNPFNEKEIVIKYTQITKTFEKKYTRIMKTLKHIRLFEQFNENINYETDYDIVLSIMKNKYGYGDLSSEWFEEFENDYIQIDSIQSDEEYAQLLHNFIDRFDEDN